MSLVTCEFPVLGVANAPEVEMRWLLSEMADCLGPIEVELNGWDFGRRLALHNEVPLGRTATREDLDKFLLH